MAAETFKFASSKDYLKEFHDQPATPTKMLPQQYIQKFPSALTGRGVKVCILDSGTFEHKSIKEFSSSSNLWKSKTSRDMCGHSHVVCGIVGASDLHNLVGLAPSSVIINAKVTDDSGYATPISVAAGVLWATVIGADVIIISHSIDIDSKPIRIALEKAVECQSVVVLEDCVGEVFPSIVHVKDIKLQYPQEKLVCLSPEDKYSIVDAKEYKPAIVGSLAALLMEKGTVIQDGLTRGEIVKSALVNLCK